MTQPTLVGFAGRKRSGKNAAADALPRNYQRVAFADPIRAALLALDPIVDVDVDVSASGYGEAAVDCEPIRLSVIITALGWERAKDSYSEVRRLLQNYGTEGVRRLDPDFWVRVAGAQIEARRSEGLPVAVTDVRFPNEVDAIVNAGGTVFRIARPGYVLPTTAADVHPSETALDGIPLPTITNDGTIAQFQVEVRRRVAARA